MYGKEIEAHSSELLIRQLDVCDIILFHSMRQPNEGSINTGGYEMAGESDF